MSSPAATSSHARTEFPELLTVGEVAAVCRVDTRTVERWAAEGRLRRVRLAPKTIRYRADDVAALLTPTDGRPATEADLPSKSAEQGRSDALQD